MYTSIRHMHYSMDAMDAIKEAQMKSILPPVEPTPEPSYYWQIYRASKSHKGKWVFVTDFQGTEAEVKDYVNKWLPNIETKVKQGPQFPSSARQL